jgi:hypothetical protein
MVWMQLIEETIEISIISRINNEDHHHVTYTPEASLEQSW